MQYAIAIAAAAVSIVAIVVLGGPGRDAAAARNGPFQITAQTDSGSVWVIDTATGGLRLCAPPRKIKERPTCGRWSR